MGGRHARPPSAGARAAAAFVATSLLGLVGFVAANAVFDNHPSPAPGDTATPSVMRTTSDTSSDGSSTSAGSPSTTATTPTAAVATTGPAGVTPAPRTTTARSRAPGTTAPASSRSSTKRPHPTHPTKPTKPGPVPTTPPPIDLVQWLRLWLRTVGP